MLTCKTCGRVVKSVFHGCPGFAEAKPKSDPLRAALEAIQELHVKRKIIDGRTYSEFCGHCKYQWPCPTRMLADEALTDRMARTNQGENNDHP